MAAGGLAEEYLNLINDGHFRFVEPGPLQTPVREFSLRRDENLTLILETKAEGVARFHAPKIAPGTVRIATDQAKLVNIGGVEAELNGVIVLSVRTRGLDLSSTQVTEQARVHHASVTLGGHGGASYLIEWLENFPSGTFIWPDLCRFQTETSSSWNVAPEDGVTITRRAGLMGSGHQVAKLTVDRNTFYVCALSKEDTPGGIKPGCIVYEGAPDEEFRRKVRVALSFALGVYLVDLGHTKYDSGWRILSAAARSPYTLWRRAFEMPPEPLAPLHPRSLNEINGDQLNRAVRAIVSSYDKLDLGNLSWAYWHACAATPHIAPAHFGAVIEALQEAYLRTRPNLVTTALLPRSSWDALRELLIATIRESVAPDEAREALIKKFATFNKVEQRPLLRSIMASLGFQIGRDEDDAWKRRNSAAHGLPIPEGDELAAIRDMKLLRGIFHRMFLGVTNMADQYVDYTSPYIPNRPLSESPPNLN